jgi:hypothetical protein
MIDRRPLVRIVARRDQAERLVEHQVHLALGHDRRAVALRRTRPSTLTCPSAIRASACVREQNPSFDRARGRLTTAPS